MQVVIDELLIGIAKETLSLRSVKVHPVRGSKVCGCLWICLCEERETGIARWWDPLSYISHFIYTKAMTFCKWAIWWLSSEGFFLTYIELKKRKTKVLKQDGKSVKYIKTQGERGCFYMWLPVFIYWTVFHLKSSLVSVLKNRSVASTHYKRGYV